LPCDVANHLSLITNRESLIVESLNPRIGASFGSVSTIGIRD
jgi:hypothetical protein